MWNYFFQINSTSATSVSNSNGDLIIYYIITYWGHFSAFNTFSFDTVILAYISLQYGKATFPSRDLNTSTTPDCD